MDSNAAGVEGLLLAGDAAGYIDPMTGDGLQFAMRGAELAAEAALGCLTSGDPQAHVALAERRKAAFGGKWRLNRGIRRLVGSPRAVSVAAHVASIAPALVRALVSAAGDCDATPRE